MRLLEKILVMFMITGLAMRLLKIPEGGILQVVASCTLSFFYVGCTFLLINNSSFKSMYERKADKTKAGDVVKSIFAGVVLGYAVLALLFKTMAWPGGNEMTETALAGLVVITVIAAVGYSRTKKGLDKQLLIRCVIYSIVMITVWLIPATMFLLNPHNLSTNNY